MPGTIGSLLLIIAGAVARYAYSDSVVAWQGHSLRVDTVGLILLLAGLVGLILSVAYGFMRPKEVEVVETVEEVEEVEEVKVAPLEPVKVVRKRQPKKKV